MESIDDILNGNVAEPTAAPAPQAEAAPEEQQQQGQPRDEHGRFAPKGEEQPEAQAPAEGAPPAPEEHPRQVPLAAQIDERRKRQEAEAERDELRRWKASLEQQQQPVQQQQAQVPANVPDPIEDPAAYYNYIQAGVERTFHLNRVAQDATAAKARHEDYADKIGKFNELLSQNPSLEAQMLAQPAPAEWAYQYVRQIMEVEQHGSIDALLEAKRKEWEAALPQQLQGNAPASPPPTLSNERNVGSRSGPAWSGPASIADILSR